MPNTYTVSNTNDTGAGSLRQAILDANANAGPDDITFTTTGTIALATTLTVSDDVNIVNPGGSASVTVTRSTGTFRLLTINNTSAVLNVSVTGLTFSGSAGGGMSTANETVNLTDVKIQNNSVSGSGGGITVGSGGTLTLTNSSVSGNTASSLGGGVYVASGATTPVSVTLTNSTVANNRSGSDGGGLYFFSGGNLRVENSTISGNSSGGMGGGFYFFGTVTGELLVTNSTIANNTAAGTNGGGGIVLRSFAGQTLTVQNSTITGNTASTTSTTDGNGGGGISMNTGAGSIILGNSIVSGNTAGNGRNDIAAIAAGTVTAVYSAIGDQNGYTLTDLGFNLTGASATPDALKLGALGNNGGPTQTVPIKFGSTALDVGDPGQTIPDQRGVTRPQGTGVDIGAFERTPGPDGTAAVTNVTSSGAPATYTFTVTYADSVAINVGTLGSADVTVTTPAGVPAVTVSYVSADTSNPNSVIATYQFTAPGPVAGWDGTDNGTYTVDMVANQVSSANGFVAAGTLATFVVAIPATYTVTDLGDTASGTGGAGSLTSGDLRFVLTRANQSAGTADTIVFQAGLTGTISLQAALPTITDSVTITGPALLNNQPQVTIARGAGTFRIFDVNGPGQITVAMSNLVVTGGNSGTGAGIQIADEIVTLDHVNVVGNSTTSAGGGIYVSAVNAGPITIRNSTVANNSAGGNGGGLNIFSTGGALVVENSTFSGNRSGGTNGGGGIHFSGTIGAGGFTITNSTIANNTAVRGGGITLTSLNGTANINSSTITGNSATTATASTATAGHGGGGIVVTTNGTAPAINLDNTIVSGNNATNGNLDVALSQNGTVVVTTQYSAVGSDFGFTNYVPGVGDLPVGAALNLGNLTDNGGPTQTVPLLAGSAAINTGNPAAPATDQRGIARPQGAGKDIGAFERVAGIPGASLTSAVNVTPANQGSANPYQFTVTYSSDSPFLIRANTIGTGDVTVTGPNGFTATATVVPPAPTTDASPLAVTYQFTAPGNGAAGWDVTDNGTYTISVNATEVQDTNNQFVPAGPLGTFQVALPQTFVVTNLADDGAGSLRQAITDANANPGQDAIVFQAGLAGTILLTSAVLGITDSVTITGPSATTLLTVSGGGARQVFNIANAASTIVVTLSNLDITGGNATTSGGGVFVSNETVTFDNVWVHGNSTTSTGGGIGSAGGATISLRNSAVTGNRSTGAGGGLYGTGTSTNVVVQNSTVSGNSSGGSGGGLGFVSIYQPSTLTVKNSTITNNTSTGGGGIRTTTGTSFITIQLVSTIVSGNNGPATSPDILAGAVDAAHSAVGDITGITTYTDVGGSVAPGTPLNLLPLANNGGTTPTHGLGGGSAAIDQGSNPDGLPTDQRGAGFVRTRDDASVTDGAGGATDIGAFEGDPSIPQASGGTTVTVDASNAAANTPYVFTVTYSTGVGTITTATINANNIVVTPPAGVGPVAVQPVLPADINAGNPASVVVTYRLTPPGGTWDFADNGQYTIATTAVAANQVKNSLNNPVPPGTVGSFAVAFSGTYVVTNTNDSGPGSLRQAILNSNLSAGALDAIVFNTNPADGTDFDDATPDTITLTSGQLTVSDSVTITGPGANLLTITAGGASRIMVDSAPDLTISGVTLTGGRVTGAGAAIQMTPADRNLTILNSVITGNSASGTGGAIYQVSGGSVTVTNSTISSNTSAGGAIRMNNASAGGGTLTVTNSKILNNVGSGNGSAFSFNFGGNLDVKNSSIAGNSTSGSGAIYLWGSPAGTYTISNSTIANNTAGGSGGGVYLAGTFNGTIDIKNSTITGNRSGTTSTTVGNGGGGIALISGTGTINLTSTIVSGNSATATNGRPDIATTAAAVVNSTYSAIGDAAGFTYTPGAGDLPVGANLDLQPLADNGGTGGPTVALGPTSAAVDQGFNLDSLPTDQRGTGFNRTIDVNTVPNGAGDATDIGAYERDPSIPQASGGTTVTVDASNAAANNPYVFTVTYSTGVGTITTATINANNIVVTPPAGVGPVAVQPVLPADINASNPASVVVTYRLTPPGGTWDIPDNGQYTIATTGVAGNQVQSSTGAHVPGVTVGTFRVQFPTTYVVTNTSDSGPGSFRQAVLDANANAGVADVIVFNTDPANGTDFDDATPDTITLTTGQLAISDAVTITGPGSGLLTVSGGGASRVFNIDGAGNLAADISGMRLTGGNGGGGAGGAILITDEAVTLTGVVVEGNSASGDGGAINMTGAAGVLTVQDSVIRNNTSTGNDGGAINLQAAGRLVVRNSTISGNSATDDGGGIYFFSGGSLLMENSTLSGNTAGTGGNLNEGGGLYFFGTPNVAAGGLVIRNSTISGNTAGSGGGIALDYFSGNLLIQNTTITGNSAGGSGGTGAVYGGGGIALIDVQTTAGTVTISSSIVSGNLNSAGPDIVTEGDFTFDHSAVGSSTGLTANSVSSYTDPGNANLAFGATLNLQPLANNGGPTQTHALGAGSAAINAGADNGLTTDQRGFAPRVVGAAADIGAYEFGASAPAAAPTVASVVVNGGGAQRSTVRSVVVTFSEVVNFAGGNAAAAAAFTLSRLTGGGNVGLVASVATVGTQTVVTLTFNNTNPAVVDQTVQINPATPSLADGRYQLTIADGAVTSAATGQALDGDANGSAGGAFVSPPDTAGSGAGFVLGLYRLFGDATGNGLVDLGDLAAFRGTFNQTGPNPPNNFYLAYLDADNNNTVDLADLGEFRTRFNVNLFA